MRRNKLATSFGESDDVGRSLAADRRKRAKTKARSGEGDKGDRPRSRPKAAKAALMKPANEDVLVSRLVSKAVGNVKNNGPELLEAAQ